jgi:sn-glycerol 3-phosphate transport system permease protein
VSSKRIRAALRPSRLLTIALALIWATPLVWMLVAAFRPERAGGAGMAALIPDYIPTLANFAEAWDSADFALYYLNTFIICAGILVVQLVTISLAGYAFARLRFPGRTLFFYLFLIQLMLAPIVL